MLNVGRGSPDPAQSTDRRSPASGIAADSGRPSVPERAGSGDPRPTGARSSMTHRPSAIPARSLVPLPVIKGRKSYAAVAAGLTSSIWHLAMTFATDFEVQLNG